MWRLLLCGIIILSVISNRVIGQENVQTRIPQSLVECYTHPDIIERDNRLPMTINMLIEIIRKVENSPGFLQQNDIRQFAVSLLHRFRLDGIARATGVFPPGVIPFSPSRFQFSKHRVLLQRLIPGTAINFPNATLTPHERCALHFMLSSTIETEVRGDEQQRCSQLSQYRAMRLPREFESVIKKRSVPQKNNYLNDIEFIQEYNKQKHKKLGNYQIEGGELDGEGLDEELPIEGGEQPEEGAGGETNVTDYDDTLNVERNLDQGLLDVASNALSQCPVECGVVRTTWGSVSVGHIIAGLAAGLQPQTIAIRDLLALSRNSQYRQAPPNRYSERQQAPPPIFAVDNRWAATLSGDLAEVALIQGPLSQQVTVGAVGTWNSTHIPRWRFLSQRERLEMTDAEIRGGIDGLILATNIAAWRSRFPTIRLSQVLDMYYSTRGVFNQIRSCDRRTLFTSVAPLADMQAQTTAFSTVLDREMQLRVTLSTEAIQTFSNAAAQSLSTYVPESLSDLSCEAATIIPNDPTIWRTSTDIYIYIDTTWPYIQIQGAIAHLLDGIDVGFGTTYTLMNAMNGAVIVPRTNSIADMYTMWNNTGHLLHPVGLDLPTIIQHIRTTGANILDAERANATVGGSSKIAVIIPQMAGVNEAESNFVMQQIWQIQEIIPDMVLLFFGGGSMTRFNRFVRDPNRDVIALQFLTTGTGDNAGFSVNALIQRIQQVPRRVINHRCGSNWQQNDWGSNSMNVFVEPRGVLAFRIHPNYFFQNSDNRRIRIQGNGYAPVQVCTSRINERPRGNLTVDNHDIECRQLNNDAWEIHLNTLCGAHWLIQECQPLFIGIQGLQTAGDGVPLRFCDTVDCRFPDEIRVTIHADNLGCFSSARKLYSFISLIILSVVLIFKI